MYKKYNLFILLLTSSFSLNAYSSSIEESIQYHKNTFSEVALAIWNHAEMGYQEFKSSNLLAYELEKEGFKITKGVAGIPTAFIAEYGVSGPVIGVLGEFDALPGLAQSTSPFKQIINNETGAGHACGHHLFGAASAWAAVAIKEWLDKNNVKGIVRFYGTPAEEGGSGKVYMVREGLFDDVDIVKVEDKVRAKLKEIHRVHPDDKQAVGGFNLGAIFTRIKNFANGMSFISLIIGIATILAGVIGIGNILLISVKERTKEIGIRRALGATPNDIRKQIVLESVFLTLIAGVIGIILGAFILYLINLATQNLEDVPFTNATVPIRFILGALLLMTGLGTLIGFIPAEKAISIKPIEALREE